MRFFVFIMSFYLLALTCYPCGDSQECNVKAEQKISASAQHRQQEHQSEACTPFCSCACCVASAFYQPIAQPKTYGLVLQEHRFYFANDDFHSYNFHTIWQPPKLS